VFTGPVTSEEITEEIKQVSLARFERRSLKALEIAGAEYQYMTHGETWEIDQERGLRVDTRYRTWPDRAAAEQWVTFMLEEGAASCTIEENA
jgi:hypothetical protein